MSRAFPEIERSLQCHGISTVHYQIYAALSEAPGHTLRLSELAAGANVSQSRLSHRLRALIDRGDVIVSDDPDDRRAKNATLTTSGFQRLEDVAPKHAEDVQRLIFDSLTPAQTEGLADAASTISEHLCEHPEYLNPKS